MAEPATDAPNAPVTPETAAAQDAYTARLLQNAIRLLKAGENTSSVKLALRAVALPRVLAVLGPVPEDLLDSIIAQARTAVPSTLVSLPEVPRLELPSVIPKEPKEAQALADRLLNEIDALRAARFSAKRQLSEARLGQLLGDLRDRVNPALERAQPLLTESLTTEQAAVLRAAAPSLAASLRGEATPEFKELLTPKPVTERAVTEARAAEEILRNGTPTERESTANLLKSMEPALRAEVLNVAQREGLTHVTQTLASSATAFISPSGATVSLSGPELANQATTTALTAQGFTPTTAAPKPGLLATATPGIRESAAQPGIFQVDIPPTPATDGQQGVIGVFYASLAAAQAFQQGVQAGRSFTVYRDPATQFYTGRLN